MHDRAAASVDPRVWYCANFPDAPDCCGACHDDLDTYGLPLPACTTHPAADVCCAVAEWLRSHPDAQPVPTEPQA